MKIRLTLPELLQLADLLTDNPVGPTTAELAAEILTQLKEYMDPKLQSVMDSLQEIKDETGQYIADRDALDVAKDAINAAQAAEIARLVAEAEAGKITLAELRSGLDAAAVTATEAAGLLPPLRVPPPVTPALADAFPGPGGIAAFDAAAAAYTGTEAVNKDGVEVHGGSQPATEYFSHADTDSVDKVGPTS